mgnify:CR=1 FL=1
MGTKSENKLPDLQVSIAFLIPFLAQEQALMASVDREE